MLSPQPMSIATQTSLNKRTSFKAKLADVCNTENKTQRIIFRIMINLYLNVYT